MTDVWEPFRSEAHALDDMAKIMKRQEDMITRLRHVAWAAHDLIYNGGVEDMFFAPDAWLACALDYLDDEDYGPPNPPPAPVVVEEVRERIAHEIASVYECPEGKVGKAGIHPSKTAYRVTKRVMGILGHWEAIRKGG